MQGERAFYRGQEKRASPGESKRTARGSSLMKTHEELRTANPQVPEQPRAALWPPREGLSDVYPVRNPTFGINALQSLQFTYTSTAGKTARKITKILRSVSF